MPGEMRWTSSSDLPPASLCPSFQKNRFHTKIHVFRYNRNLWIHILTDITCLQFRLNIWRGFPADSIFICTLFEDEEQGLSRYADNKALYIDGILDLLRNTTNKIWHGWNKVRWQLDDF